MRKRPVCLGVCACLIGLAGVLIGHAQTVPEATALRCGISPRIDGTLDDSCWGEAVPWGEFHVLAKDTRPSVATTVKAAYDNAWLYFGIVSECPRADMLRQSALDHDSRVSGDESVELFVDAGTDGRRYLHYLLSFANIRAEQRVTKNGGADRNWSIPWRSATHVTKRGWQAEIALPLSVIAAHGDLSRLRVNILRNAFIPEIDSHGVAINERTEISSWAFILKSSQEPERFGCLNGVAPKPMETPLLAAFSNGRVRPYRTAGGTWFYDVEMDVTGYGGKPGAVRINVTDQPVGGTKSVAMETMAILPGKSQVARVPVPLRDLAPRHVRVTMEDAATGDQLQSAPIADTSILHPLWAYLDRSYYTTEDQGTAIVLARFPEESLKGTALTVLDATGKPLGRASSVGPENRVAFSLAGLPIGTHTLRVEFTGAGGIRFGQDLILKKLSPKPGLETKIDQVNRVLLRNGRPFFPYGILPEMATTDENAWNEMTDMGFNTVVRWDMGIPPDRAMSFHEAAARHNLMVIDAPDRYATVNMITLKARPDFTDIYRQHAGRMAEAVNRMKDSPALLAYMGFDEPDYPVIEAGRLLYRQINDLDGYHPQAVIYGSRVLPDTKWTDWADVIAVDPYWVPGETAFVNAPGYRMRGNVNFVSGRTALTSARGEAERKVSCIVPMAELWSGVRKRALLPREQFCQTYLAVIHGAKGIFYFRYPFWHQATFDTLKALGREMQVIGPIAVTPDIPQQVRYTPGAFDAERDLYPDVQVALRHNPNGGLVLLAANSQYYPVDVTYRVPLLGRTGTVRRLFSDMTYPVTDFAFTERLEFMTTRAYLLEAQAPATGQVEIAVEMKPHPDQSDPLYAAAGLPDAGRPGKKNIIRNPSFEEASLSGWPDYFRRADSLRPRLCEPGTTADWGLDTKNPFHGKVSLRLHGWGPDSKGRKNRQVTCTLSPQSDKPREYVLSAWMRADRNGTTARFIGPGFGQKVFTLTTGWQRYEEAGVIPARVSPYSEVGVVLPGAEGAALWVDAMQLEQGKVATEFEE